MGRQSFCREKKILDFVILAIQPPAVMDWFPAAATGRDARRDALPDQHLMDFVPVLPLIPHHRGRRRQVLAHPIRTGEVTALPFTQVEPQATTFIATDPIGACWSCPPFVEAGRRGMGFDVSGVNHQHLWLWGIRRLCAVGWLCGIGC